MHNKVPHTPRHFCSSFYFLLLRFVLFSLSTRAFRSSPSTFHPVVSFSLVPFSSRGKIPPAPRDTPVHHTRSAIFLFLPSSCLCQQAHHISVLVCQRLLLFLLHTDLCGRHTANRHPMALSLVPQTAQPSQVRNTQHAPQAPSAPGSIDTLRANGPVSIASQINNRHPIEARILHWDENSQRLQMETRRRLLGMADPIKREMELALVQQSEFRPLVLGGSSRIHSDILQNKDCSVDWEDVYPVSSDLLLHTAPASAATALHSELEAVLHV